LPRISPNVTKLIEQMVALQTSLQQLYTAVAAVRQNPCLHVFIYSCDLLTFCPYLKYFTCSSLRPSKITGTLSGPCQDDVLCPGKTFYTEGVMHFCYRKFMTN
jgi:hypothetical protein